MTDQPHRVTNYVREREKRTGTKKITPKPFYVAAEHEEAAKLEADDASDEIAARYRPRKKVTKRY